MSARTKDSRPAYSMPPIAYTAEERLRHYTPEEVEEKGLLPLTARQIRTRAYKREIPFVKVGRGIALRLDHIEEISRRYEVGPRAA